MSSRYVYSALSVCVAAEKPLWQLLWNHSAVSVHTRFLAIHIRSKRWPIYLIYLGKRATVRHGRTLIRGFDFCAMV